MFELPRKGQHTHAVVHTVVRIVYILVFMVLTMGDRKSVGQFVIGQTNTHVHAYTHKLCTFNQYILVEFCLFC